MRVVESWHRLGAVRDASSLTAIHMLEILATMAAGAGKLRVPLPIQPPGVSRAQAALLREDVVE